MLLPVESRIINIGVEFKQKRYSKEKATSRNGIIDRSRRRRRMFGSWFYVSD